MALGGHLVSVHSQEEQKFVGDLRPANKPVMWMGGSDTVEKLWVWSDGTTFEFTFWDRGEPNNELEEDCLTMRGNKWNGEWNDKSCDNKFMFFCKTRVWSTIPDVKHKKGILYDIILWNMIWYTMFCFRVL